MYQLMKQKQLNAKGQLGIGAIPAIVIMFVVIGLVISLGLLINSNVQTEVEEESGSNISAAANATRESGAAIGEFSDWQGMMALVIVAVILISLVMLLQMRGAAGGSKI